ncbi:type VI secretion system baseplate subunit TssF [Rhizobium halophytocola]|uniref:Type VI secretion system protein ImpG n=1 Tax=Rhizobium halophytocola TaxID=735519 RepID=A0ABS4E676_9HYPH|nr:type VI secretion system baseplate subunit TssF [Rhizobium halophytocola]MBP1853449.1 type VI secretion system protein ImpG [Rhizobium halophytocola]
MAEGFLERYNEELHALRRRATRFAEAFPKIAGRLRMSGAEADDPHVERLVQSFAYSAARIRQKLDDEFPELTDSLLETLYPHFLAPLPSMSIVRFTPSAQLAAVQTVPRHSEILAEPVNGETCRFRTTQATEVSPIEIASAALASQPIDAPLLPGGGVASCLRVSLRLSAIRPQSFSDIGLKSLKFFIGSSWQQATALHELLTNHCVGLALARHAQDANAVFLPAACLKASGFANDEAMLPYPPTSFEGYRLLTEFFALPQKFLFLDIDGLDRWPGGDCELYIYLDESNAKLERSVSASDFVLNATPVINLFRQTCEPISIDGSSTEYRLVPDGRRHQTREVHRIETVRLTTRNGREELAQPFFGRPSIAGGKVQWQGQRRFDDDDGTSDTNIAFVDRERGPLGPLDMVASVDTLCLNRNLPEQLPFGGGHPRLQLASGSDAVDTLVALIPPTPSVRLNQRSHREWRLVSHLLLNHLSLFDNGGNAFKDLMALYAFRDAPETRRLTEAISRIEAKASHALIGQAMVPGTDVTMEFDPAVIDRPAAYLFGSVLDHFLGLYTSINTFTRLTVTMRGQSSAVLRRPARAARRPLV